MLVMIMLLYLFVLTFPAHEMAAQECSNSSCQKSGFVSNKSDWEMDNTDGDRGPGDQPEPIGMGCFYAISLGLPVLTV